MFTGIVEELGSVHALDAHRLEVACGVVTDDSDVGASVAVNGVCLTVVARTADRLGFDLSDETIALMKEYLAGAARESAGAA